MNAHLNRIMGCNCSTLIAAVSGVAVIYLFHSLFYSSHTLMKTHTVFECKLPGSAYLTTRYIYQSIHKTPGHVRKDNTTDELVFTLINCRYESVSLRRFCSLAGYGWDYPDSNFRGIPLCYPEFLCARLLSMIVCSERFKLSPAGLLSVRETLTLYQPVDDVKRGPFSLQARVMEYRDVSAGVEVDITLTASREQQPVWSSTLTLLSPNKTYRPHAQLDREVAGDPSSERSVQLAVPWTTGLRCAWVFSDLFLLHVFSLSASLLGFTSLTAHPLWMLSRCMAEVEKYKSDDVVRAPLTVSVRFIQPLSLPGNITIRFSDDTTETKSTTLFSMENQRTRTPYISGQIKRHSDESR